MYSYEREVTIIEVVADDTFIIECAYCDGSGIEPRYMDKTTFEVTKWNQGECWRCHGTGLVRIRSNGELVAHGPCHGTGRRNSFYHERNEVGVSFCKECSGLGVVSLRGRVDVQYH